jgi:hypothetical protein
MGHEESHKKDQAPNEDEEAPGSQDAHRSSSDEDFGEDTLLAD